MAELLTIEPTLLVRDIEAAANYYRDCLGFDYEYDLKKHTPPDFCIVNRGALSIMLCLVLEPSKPVPNCCLVRGMWNLYFQVDDIHSMYDEFSKRGAFINQGIGSTDYGALEFRVRDVDGYELAFVQFVEPGDTTAAHK